jgi:tetratricopeptide (TPR) repeat protein
MMLLGVFRKKEKEEKKEAATPQPVQKTLLEGLCGDDKELYEVVITTILLNPEMTVKEGVNSYLEKAKEYEKAKDYMKARIAYQVAGEISLYEGKLSQAQDFFKKAAEVDLDYAYRKVFEYFSKKEKAEKVLAIAQEFYAKTGKRTKKKEDSGD